MGFSGVLHPVPTFLNNYGYNPAPSAGLPTKPAYSMIGCLEGHGAAVNAVQIHGDEVVSASGDRTVKVWNWPEQTCTRTLIGHTKGIACVQYDGRRIVSGSSDNEVKVFDKESGLEVASLRAHTNLVRTVQAGFGDLPYSAEEDQEDARAIDHEYFKAVDSGAIPRTVYLQRGRPRNAGSRRPEDITAYGAKLPPGGGGGRFGRIVSGSYDETIIIWRRDKEGVWRAQHTLRQEEAAASASRTLESEPVQSPQPVVQSHATPSIDVDAPVQPFAPGSDQFYRHLIETTGPTTSLNNPSSVTQSRPPHAHHPQPLPYGGTNHDQPGQRRTANSRATTPHCRAFHIALSTWHINISHAQHGPAMAQHPSRNNNPHLIILIRSFSPLTSHPNLIIINSSPHDPATPNTDSDSDSDSDSSTSSCAGASSCCCPSPSTASSPQRRTS